MQAPKNVGALDVGAQIPARLVAGGRDAVVDALDFERVEEALHGRIVETGTLPAYRRRYVRRGKGLAIRVGRILDAAIRMLE